MNKKRIYRNYLNTAINIGDGELETISESSINRVDSELLFSIVVIEKMNRGNLSNYIFEKLISIVAPSVLIKSNASIGLCQIRVAAARKVSNLSDKKIAKRLMNPAYNIFTMAKLIRLYNEVITNEENRTKTILNLHITSKKEVPPNIYLNMYYELVSWSMKQKNFSRIYTNHKKSGT